MYLLTYTPNETINHIPRYVGNLSEIRVVGSFIAYDKIRLYENYQKIIYLAHY